MLFTVSMIRKWLEERFPTRPMSQAIKESIWVNPPLLYDPGEKEPASYEDHLQKNYLYVSEKIHPTFQLHPEACYVICNGQNIPENQFYIGFLEKQNVNIILNSLQECFIFYDGWELRTKDISVHGTLQQLLNHCTSVTQNALILIDQNNRVLACSAHGKDRSLNELSLYFGKTTSELPWQTISFKRLLHRNRSIKEPQFATLEENGGITVIYMSIEIDVRERHCLLMLPTDHELTNFDMHLFQVLSDYARASVLINRDQKNYKDGQLEKLCQSIITGNTISEELIQSEEYKAGLLKKGKSCAVFALPEGTTPEYAATLTKELANLLSASIVFSSTDKLIIIFEPSEDAVLSPFVKDALSIILRDYRVYAGISECFGSLSELYLFYNEAIAALQFGIDKGYGRIILFPEHKLDLLLSECTKVFPLDRIMPDSLKRLFEYNKTVPTDYLQTLQIWLEEGMNAARSAERLSIKRNSLLPRLERITEIVGEDLNDYDCRFLILLCLRMMR